MLSQLSIKLVYFVNNQSAATPGLISSGWLVNHFRPNGRACVPACLGNPDRSVGAMVPEIN